MRPLVTSLALVIVYASAQAVAIDADDNPALKGNVSQSSIKRLPRPGDLPVKFAESTQRAASWSVGLDTGAFDLRAHRKQIQAGTTIGIVPGWIQAPTPGPEEIHAGMDKFFAPAHIMIKQALAHELPGNTPAFDPRLPTGFNVFVRIGLCGLWDVQGDGLARWRVLAREMYMPGPLNGAWRGWQMQISQIIKDESPQLQEEAGVASLHLEVLPDGSVNAVLPYSGGERPFVSVVASQAADRNLAKVLATIGRLPPFPAGSQAKECHVLVFISNN